MMNNPSKRLPKDYSRYQGKMDHTTCICWQYRSPDCGEHEQPPMDSTGIE
jgi:hypothetical protein